MKFYNATIVRFTTVILAVLFSLLFTTLFAQNGVLVGPTTGSAHASAMLEVNSTNKGFLLPRVNLVALNNGTSPVNGPAPGLLVYNLGAGGVPAVGVYYWDGSTNAWVQLTAGGMSGSGTTDYVARWTSPTSLGIGIVRDDGTNVGIGVAPGTYKVNIQGGSLNVGTMYGSSVMYGTLGSYDTRSTNPWPETYYMGVTSEFKGNSTIGLVDGGSFNSVLSIRQWSSSTDWSGGGVHQLAFTPNGNMWNRYSETTGAWGNWKKVTPSTTFVHWGRADCPSTSSLVYWGYAGGGAHNHSGSGANTLCMTSTPDWTGASYNDGNHNGGLIYGTEFQGSGYGIATYGSLTAAQTQDYDATCAVCIVEGASVTMMVPGATICPANQGWTRQYWGYLMSTHYTHYKSEFVCVVNNPTQNGVVTNHDGNLWYPVEKENGSLGNPGVYPHDRELTCVVCTK